MHRSALARRPAARDVVALVQGASYLGFATWALTARSHYRRVHRLRAEPWLLNAHAMWMGLVGSALVAAGLHGNAEDRAIRLLGTGAAAGLAFNDLMTRNLPGVYRSDLLWETALSLAWLVVPPAEGGGDE